MIPLQRKPTHEALANRYYALIGRPLMSDDANDLRHVAALLGVKLEWKRFDLNDDRGIE